MSGQGQHKCRPTHDARCTRHGVHHDAFALPDLDYSLPWTRVDGLFSMEHGKTSSALTAPVACREAENYGWLLQQFTKVPMIKDAANKGCRPHGM